MALLILVGVIMVVIIARNALEGYRRTEDPPTHVCADCGTTCSQVGRHRAGWTFLFFPLNLALAEKKLQSCPECQGKLIPVNSPRGKLLS